MEDEEKQSLKVKSYENIKRNTRNRSIVTNMLLNNSDDSKKDTINESTLRIWGLIPFKNHPFKLYEGERFEDMVSSIKKIRHTFTNYCKTKR